MLGNEVSANGRDPIRTAISEYVWGHISQHLVLTGAKGRKCSFDLEKQESILNARTGQYTLVPVHLELNLEYKAEPRGNAFRVSGQTFREALSSAEAKS